MWRKKSIDRICYVEIQLGEKKSHLFFESRKDFFLLSVKLCMDVVAIFY